MVVEVPRQGLFELAELGPHARTGQLGEHLGVTLSCDHRLEHVAARHPEDVACHRRQLDLGVLQELLHPLLVPGPFPDERAPVTGQVTQPADRAGGTKLGRHMPRSTTLASHTPSSLSVLGRPGTFLTCLALSSQQVNPSASSR
jgi:hypothetical protein